jgi:hypothetical protein
MVQGCHLRFRIRRSFSQIWCRFATYVSGFEEAFPKCDTRLPPMYQDSNKLFPNTMQGCHLCIRIRRSFSQIWCKVATYVSGFEEAFPRYDAGLPPTYRDSKKLFQNMMQGCHLCIRIRRSFSQIRCKVATYVSGFEEAFPKYDARLPPMYQDSKKLFPDMMQCCHLLQCHIYLHVRYVRNRKRKNSYNFFLENLVRRDSCEDVNSVQETSAVEFESAVLCFAFLVPYIMRCVCYFFLKYAVKHNSSFCL